MRIKKLLIATSVTLLSGLCLNAQAATNTVHGTACQWSEPEYDSIIAGYQNPNGYKNVRYTRYGIENKNYPVTNSFLRTNSASERAIVVCPLTIEESVGSNANIRAHIQDTKGNNKCRATIRDSKGNNYWKGDWKRTDETGTNIDFGLGNPSVSDGGVNFQVVVECDLHATDSRNATPATVRAIRVY